MKRLLVICPSINRSKTIEKFLKSFKETASEGTHLILGLDNKDPQYEHYLKHSEEYDFSIGLFDGENITIILNAIAMNPENNYDYYMPINDDFVFKNKGWDKILIDEIESHGTMGIAFGNDLFQNNYPSTSVISGEIVRTLGWLQMPKLNHLCGDIVWKIIGESVGCIYYRKDVIIKHEHFLPEGVAPDEVYKRTNSKEMYDVDNAALNNWIISESSEDIRKVKELCHTKNIV